MAPAALAAIALAAPPMATAQASAPEGRKIGARTEYVLKIMAPGPPAYPIEASYLNWPLAPGDQRYGRIDGAHLKTYVDAQVKMSRDYRDAGHQYWGRIMGTSADAVSAEWMTAQFRRIGLKDVRQQAFDVPTTTLPKAWSVSAGHGQDRVALTSALPIGKLITTAPEGAAAPAVYVGLGEAADFAGRDVAGKAVFLYAVPEPSSFFSSADMNGAVERAERAGAAAIYVAFGLPGNISAHMLLRTDHTPLFVIGKEDGARVREMIEAGGPTPVVTYALSAETREDLKTALVWGVLPGRTKETIYVLAHRDGYFEAALDNASGVATMLGLAEYYARIPQKDRRRTIVFVGTPGHHDPRFIGTSWMHDNREALFGQTALVINAEHTAYVDAQDFMGTLRKSNAVPAFNWHVGGSKLLSDICTQAFQDFGVPLLALPDQFAPGETGRISEDAPLVQIVSGAWPYHSSADTADIIPATGLAASTRAYAKIIDAVNRRDIVALRAPSQATRPKDPRAR